MSTDAEVRRASPEVAPVGECSKRDTEVRAHLTGRQQLVQVERRFHIELCRRGTADLAVRVLQVGDLGIVASNGIGQRRYVPSYDEPCHRRALRLPERRHIPRSRL